MAWGRSLWVRGQREEGQSQKAEAQESPVPGEGSVPSQDTRYGAV